MPEIVVLGIYTSLLVIVGVFALIQLHLSIRYLGAAKRGQASGRAFGDGNLPTVTVQLPVYNELYVVTRLLDSVAQLDYPKELLEIQVLDDSTDETSAIVAHKLGELAHAGLKVAHLRRDSREGFKAGALQEGLRHASGEFVAIFDADFVPNSDFLKQTVAYFDDDRVAAVQTRWGHLNESQSLVTRIYAFMLNAHFTVEQRGRNASGYFINFNGTAGLWRRRAIEDAGGWRADTLTEDLDLSYRAQLRGWRLVYLADVISPAELPADMPGVRSQQRRWIKGGAENARLHLGAVLRSKQPSSRRLHACAHLLSSSLYLVVLTAILLSVLLTFLKNTYIETDYLHFGLPFLVATCCLARVYYVAQGTGAYRAWGKLRFVAFMVLFLVFTLGLSVQCGIAALQGWLGRRSEFVRTPKHGTGNTGIHWTKNRYVKRHIDRDVVVEACVVLLILAALVHGVRHNEFGLVPLQLMAAAGIIWVIGLSLWHMTLRRRQAVTVEGEGALPGARP